MKVGSDRRLGVDQLVLERIHPRAGWAEHPKLGGVGRFWLQRHDMFRQLDTILRDGLGAAVDGADDDPAFRPWLTRHLSFWFGQLQEHHHVEDHHYFPTFRRIEPRLAAGFELLEHDHLLLDAAIMRAMDLARAALAHEPVDRAALGRLRDAHVGMAGPLLLHLDDEEDLVIPLLIERGELPLG
jgi:hypothetical protein